MNKYWYYVDGYEDRLFDDDGEACVFIGDMSDAYTDEGLQQMCEDEIIEISGIGELIDYCENEEECIFQYITIEELKEYHKELNENDEFDLYYNNKYIK